MSSKTSETLFERSGNKVNRIEIVDGAKWVERDLAAGVLEGVWRDF